jgi:hypothetical protein
MEQSIADGVRRHRTVTLSRASTVPDLSAIDSKYATNRFVSGAGCRRRFCAQRKPIG